MRWIRRPPSTGMPATSCDNLRTPTPWPNVRDYEGRIGLSPPAAYPSIVGHEMHSPAPIYLGTSLTYIGTAQIPRVPDPTDRQVKDLGVPESMMNHHLTISLNLFMNMV
jgi:hypothetical protein